MIEQLGPHATLVTLRLESGSRRGEAVQILQGLCRGRIGAGDFGAGTQSPQQSEQLRLHLCTYWYTQEYTMIGHHTIHCMTLGVRWRHWYLEDHICLPGIQASASVSFDVFVSQQFDTRRAVLSGEHASVFAFMRVCADLQQLVLEVCHLCTNLQQLLQRCNIMCAYLQQLVLQMCRHQWRGVGDEVASSSCLL